MSVPPADGAANDAVVRLLAKALRLRQRDVTIVAGDTARVKQLRLSGDAMGIVARLEELTSKD